ncbi:RDD family protein [Microbacterium sp. zg.B48]|uniref:RDD family protein n=1 Tax=unclassified Microbacterium TaxID=2609290 RepID=UPI00214B9CE8|nr:MULTISPECIES: RDD family protein [unclassified Microbacterium]MCR2764635.1 RDD family protein [Microbacterium sp. zg.B48]MCR2810228.1 RDD family protein [Microbacterium sp. zg.B185]WIM19942.1 RDD family protein [Microbacterium sp. zg-B185]
MPASDPPVAPARVIEIQQDEVLTGEAVALDVQPVGFFLRGLGALIDVLVGIGALLLFLLVTSWLVGQSLVDAVALPILSVTVLVTVTVVIPTVVETMTRGRSLGKLAVGGRIVRTDGGASGFRQAFIRALTGVLEIWLTLGAVAALVGAFTPRAQRLGDLLAGTYSERTRTPRLPPPGPPVPPALAGWAAVADVARLPDRLSRRIAQFTQSAAAMQPPARARLAATLAAEAAVHVSPVPAVDEETFLRAVVAVRRDRELRALQLEQQRVAALTGPTGAPRGFPER